jgi:hypothetical protein
LNELCVRTRSDWRPWFAHLRISACRSTAPRNLMLPCAMHPSPFWQGL